MASQQLWPPSMCGIAGQRLKSSDATSRWRKGVATVVLCGQLPETHGVEEPSYTHTRARAKHPHTHTITHPHLRCILTKTHSNTCTPELHPCSQKHEAYHIISYIPVAKSRHKHRSEYITTEDILFPGTQAPQQAAGTEELHHFRQQR